MIDYILNSQILRLDYLTLFIGIFVIFFTLVTILYSIGFMRGKKGKLGYYFLILLTCLSSLGVVLSNHLVLLLVFWGFLCPLLYLLINFGEKERTPQTAKKAFVIVAGTDALMIFGLALVWKMTGTFRMDQIHLALTSKSAIVAYLCFLSGVFAKAGAMPFHTWIPDTAEDAPTPVTAFLPASLDKLLGIYFLVRISLDLFQMTPVMNTILMGLGSFTIVAAVMMALVQHDLKRLLGYHAVSQVGYMVLGIGTGNMIGIAGGLFHMLNHAIYKSCLFFSGGAVEQRAQTTGLEKLGGFVKIMPVTFITFLIASFAISGVPPFNGFASKWIIYQGVIEAGKSGGRLWVVWLIAAMFGSALTLASFMKLIHAVFLGQPSANRSPKEDGVKEAGMTMLIPTVTLATLCVLFGVFAQRLPLKMLILPSLKDSVVLDGIWNSGLATAMIIAGIAVGILIYFLGTFVKTRQTDSFVGGEDLRQFPDMRLSGTEFYNTIQDYGILRQVYEAAGKKAFDIYEMGTKFVLGINRFVSYLHNGVLPTYLSWCLLGALILFYIFLR